MPEPHSPVTPVDATADCEARLVAPRSTPITLTRARQRFRSIRTLDGAGGRPPPAADLGALERRPRRDSRPAKAGGDRRATISALVPMSTTS